MRYLSNRLRIFNFLWGFLWFWMGLKIGLPIVFKNNLFISSAINVFIPIFIGVIFFFLWLNIKNRKSIINFSYIFIFYLIVFFICLYSPFINRGNFLRVFGFFFSSFSIVFSIWVFVSFSPSLSISLIKSGRFYIFGLLSSSLLLLLNIPHSLSGIFQASFRLGDVNLLHPNTYGFALGFGFIFLIFIPIFKNKIINILITLILLLGLILTQSKTAIFSVFIALLFNFFFSRKINIHFYFILLFFYLIFLILYAFEIQMFPFLRSINESVFLISLINRVDIWSVVLDLVSKRPFFGYGFGVFEDVIYPFMTILRIQLDTIVHAHNAFFDVLFSYGYFGLVFFLIIIFKAIISIFRSLKQLNWRPPSNFLFVVLIFIISHSVTEASLNLQIDFWFLIWLTAISEKIYTVTVIKESFPYLSS
ncbi:MAG TPA: hypothetical protein DCY12_01270 [Candidatus Atribacteria bacterium]|nr:hypothetical protein [Candidatus Atribacteria bacterium]